MATLYWTNDHGGDNKTVRLFTLSLKVQNPTHQTSTHAPCLSTAKATVVGTKTGANRLGDGPQQSSNSGGHHQLYDTGNGSTS